MTQDSTDVPDVLEAVFEPLPGELPAEAMSALNRVRVIDCELDELRAQQYAMALWRQVAMCRAVDAHPDGAAGVARDLGMSAALVQGVADRGREYAYLRLEDIHGQLEGDFVYTLVFDQVEGQPLRHPITSLAGHLMLDTVARLADLGPGGFRTVQEDDGATLRFIAHRPLPG